MFDILSKFAKCLSLFYPTQGREHSQKRIPVVERVLTLWVPVSYQYNLICMNLQHFPIVHASENDSNGFVISWHVIFQ